jgi:type IV secretion system protein VirD4
MSFPFGNLFKSEDSTSAHGFDPQGRRILGQTFEGEIILAPKGHSLLLSAAGGGKSTCGAMPWLYSYLSSANRPAILVFDSKDGELAAQSAPMIADIGIPVAIIDDMGVFGEHNPYRVSINPLGGVVSTYQNSRPDLVFATENANNALIADPPDDAKNQYFRDWPRSILEFIQRVLLKRKPLLTTPGSVWELLSNPEMLDKMAEIEAVEGDGDLQALAKDILDMRDHEHWPQHRAAALKALRIFAAGSRLYTAGRNADTTHAQLIKDRAVIFLVGPQAYMNRLGAYYALNILGFTEALYAGAGPLAMIGDEFSNAPLKSLVESLTTLRAYGGEFHMIAQSRSEIERRFGKLETQTIEENSIVKQWMGASSFEEAERISKAMGEERVISSNLGTNNESMRLQSTYQTGKDRVFTPSMLMAMPRDEQLIHIKGIGFIHARKIAMNRIAPYCHLIGDNPLEGRKLPADPIITLQTVSQNRR